MDYTIRVIAARLVANAVIVSAQSEEEALAEVAQRLSPKLKREGYEIQLEILETVERAQSARLIRSERGAAPRETAPETELAERTGRRDEFYDTNSKSK